MTDTRDPPRFLDEASTLPRELAREMEAYSAMGPSTEQRERMFAGLELALVTSSAVPPPSTSGPRFWSLWQTKILGTAVVVMASVWGYQTLSRPSEVAAREVAPAVVNTEHVVVEQAPLREPDAPPSPSVGVEEVVPKPEKKRLSKGAARPKPSTTVEPVESVDPVAELSLLSRARRVLSASPTRALEITAEHARLYPRGALSEEREVLAIDALMHADQRERAMERARLFEQGHPRSAHLARIRVILSGP